MQDTYIPRGKYFDDFVAGDVIVSAGRTITEADIVNFAGLSGDYTQIHINAEAARAGKFGQRIAHGFLVISVVSGLLAQLGFIEGTVLAFREMSWKFQLPVFIGDTIHARAQITGLKGLPRMDGGAVNLEVQVINQDDQVVQSGLWMVLVASRSGPSN